MKKFLVIFILIFFVFSFAGCVPEKEESTIYTTVSTTETPTTENEGDPTTQPSDIPRKTTVSSYDSDKNKSDGEISDAEFQELFPDYDPNYDYSDDLSGSEDEWLQELEDAISDIYEDEGY